LGELALQPSINFFHRNLQLAFLTARRKHLRNGTRSYRDVWIRFNNLKGWIQDRLARRLPRRIWLQQFAAIAEPDAEVFKVSFLSQSAICCIAARQGFAAG
jgi:hypothetical protein